MRRILRRPPLLDHLGPAPGPPVAAVSVMRGLVVGDSGEGKERKGKERKGKEGGAVVKGGKGADGGGDG